ncbi:MAG: hypothetical protein IT501_09695 [Rubrivivax sp.]|nr:hypothetical protein [Rubrivivax sp.]
MAITTSVEDVEAGSAQVAQAGHGMAQIVSAVKRVSELIDESTASRSEQRDGINQVNQAVRHLDQMTQQNAALVEQASAAAASMSEQVPASDTMGAGRAVSTPARPLHARARWRGRSQC